MNFLIVEDSDYKISDIEEFLRTRYNNCNVTVRRSYRTGLFEILTKRYDLILLDMSMPTYDTSAEERGHRFRPIAGREILLEMKRKGVFAKTVVITQFDTFPDGTELSTLKTTLKQEFPDFYLGTIKYDGSVNEWKSELERVLKLQFKV